MKSGTDKKAAYAAICDADQKNALKYFLFFFNIYLVITFYLFLGFRMIFAKIVSKRCFVLMANGSALSQTNKDKYKFKEFTRDNIEDVSNPPYADLLEMKDKLEWIS